MDEKAYRNILRAPERALHQMLLDFRFFREDVPGVIVFTEEFRIKTLESAIRKSQDSQTPIDELQDLAAVRIVVGTSQQVDVVRRFFTRQQDLNDLVIELDGPISKNGYRSNHVVVKYPPSYSRSVSFAKVEIQIPTVFQHAFNNLSRTWVYKTPYLFSSKWQNKFQELSTQLHSLNDAASVLYAEFIESTQATDPNAPLTPFSVQCIVKSEFGEIVELNDAVDTVIFLREWRKITSNAGFQAFLNDVQLERIWRKSQELCDEGDGFPSLSRWNTYMFFCRNPDGAKGLFAGIRNKHLNPENFKED